MRKIALILALMFVLTGCASLPTTGDVHVRERPTQLSGQINFDPQGPTPGAKPEDIVDGFIRASGAGLADDFSVARQYLTPEAATVWNPTAQVRIYPDNQNHNLSRTRSGAVRVSAPAYGALDSSGVYSVSASDAVISAEFSLMKNSDNEWRIAVLEDGVILPDSLFRSLYQETILYFYTADSRFFVPDVRWLPQSRVLPLAVAALTEGPSNWLTGAVRSALPSGTTLGSEGVTVRDQTAVIDLSSNITALSDIELSRLAAQLSKTLVGTGQVQDVDITSAGSPVDIGSIPDISSYPLENFPVTGIRNGEIVTVTRSDGVETQIGGEAVQDLGLLTVAPGYGTQNPWVAALGNERQSLYRIDTAQGAADSIGAPAGELVSPSTDRYGYIWSASVENTGEIFAADGETLAIHSLPVTVFSGARVEQMRVSREGSRLVFVAEVDGVPTMYTASIERSQTGEPISIGEPRRLGTRLADIGDVSWIDDRTLVVAGNTTAGVEYNLYTVTIGGPMTGESFSSAITGLTSARGEESVIIETASGTLYEYDAGAWRVLASEVLAPAFPG